ncbi:deoxyribose-phosphate aldolase [Fulvivirga kasyanovii]|uniref:Deoxyribose-phosphate aldolase n=1 Tax=Fulvivirga kasyanovii TaxID=396812 RepID=A0ABW9RVV5_9BACT|nr:deoxyribose-phosphate aldolase [Fulvivirga kasyanovii]MTI28123.1 deoxyribose-phosphate aldolase [Fulvivirga kasyanovii]
MNNLNRFIEQTNLKPTFVAGDVDVLVKQAVDHNFLGICVPPFWVKKASREIGDRDVQLVTVIGFPLGYNMTETKIQEIDLAIRDGADELDIVMNISSFKTGLPWTKIELAKCCNLIHDHYKLVKVIIETAYLSSEEIETACKLCADAGVDFVKTSTGFAGAGAKVEHIELMRKVLPSNVGIKASGGIKTYQQAVELIMAGADRIGTSSGVEILAEAK